MRSKRAVAAAAAARRSLKSRIFDGKRAAAR